MLGAIAGDVIGSVYEWDRIKSCDFPLFDARCAFTDDSVLTVATAHVILNGAPYDRAYLEFGRRYPRAGYGARFARWLQSDTPRPYNSYGNGSAMRVSPVGFAYDDAETVLREARRSAEVTHDHPEGVKGAQATALAVFRARTGASKDDIRDEIQRRFAYDLERTVAGIRPAYQFDESCQRTVPEAIIAFLESSSVEDAIRLAVSLGGDSDTLAAITGGIAQAYYGGVPGEIAGPVLERLTPDLLDVVQEFERRYPRACGGMRLPS